MAACAARPWRRLLLLGFGALAWPASRLVAQPRPWRIAVLGGTTGDAIAVRNFIEPLRRGLAELGHVEGRHYTLTLRWADGQPERLPGLLGELVALRPDVLVTIGPRPAQLARDGAAGLSVVAVGVDDPVISGLAQSVARPGGHITGLSTAFDGLVQKRLQLLKDIVPEARRLGILMNPITLRRAVLEAELPAWQRALGLELRVFEARAAEDFAAAFDAMVRERLQGVVILADAVFWTHRQALGALVFKHRLPSAWGGRDYLDAGGLVSYQGDWPALYRRAATLVDKVLKGTPPGDIPFEQGTKLELVVSLKGARALGIKIPQAVLLSADEVIE